MAEITSSTYVLAVNDLELSRQFYCEKLGFTEDLAVEGWSFLSRGACKLRKTVRRLVAIGSARTAVRQVREYLQENYAENVSLVELAHLVGLSAFHLTRLFAPTTNRDWGSRLGRTDRGAHS